MHACIDGAKSGTVIRLFFFLLFSFSLLSWGSLVVGERGGWFWEEEVIINILSHDNKTNIAGDFLSTTTRSHTLSPPSTLDRLTSIVYRTFFSRPIRVSHHSSFLYFHTQYHNSRIRFEPRLDSRLLVLNLSGRLASSVEKRTRFWLGAVPIRSVWLLSFVERKKDVVADGYRSWGD